MLGHSHLERPMYLRPFTGKVDYIPLLRGFEPLEFSPGNYGEVGSKYDYKLKLFGSTLTIIAFSWNSKLPTNSIDTWTEMEKVFHKQLYKEEQEVIVVDMSKITQFPRKPIEYFLTRFKEARLRCNTEIPEGELIALAVKGMLVQFRKKFDDLDFQDFPHLTTRAFRYERVIRKEQNMMNLSKGTYYRDSNYMVANIEDDLNQEVAMAKILSKKSYICKDIVQLEPPK
ncbi:uncharacterized protein LOC120010100 [Tripterygium wilfordii]|uniref:uncharacterized protein LOC120010100 n=1 Tax=Tripterygium wilfordii TaxID=458696 RepID=UPI0018F80631|nr:uncharacterized protein LOC120010100 [Tripterygium wilfordii]